MARGEREDWSGWDDRGEGNGREGLSENSGSNELFDNLGIDVEGMSPRGQAAVGMVVGGGVLAAVAGLLIFAPWLWWLVFFFGWAIFPALGLFAKGVGGMVDSPKPTAPAPNSRERELLEAVERHGEVTPARVALETSLTVDEADRKLSELAEKGHLEVRVRGGGLAYALWESDSAEERREITGE